MMSQQEKERTDHAEKAHSVQQNSNSTTSTKPKSNTESQHFNKTTVYKGKGDCPSKAQTNHNPESRLAGTSPDVSSANTKRTAYLTSANAKKGAYLAYLNSDLQDDEYYENAKEACVSGAEISNTSNAKVADTNSGQFHPLANAREQSFNLNQSRRKLYSPGHSQGRGHVFQPQHHQDITFQGTGNNRPAFYQDPVTPPRYYYSGYIRPAMQLARPPPGFIPQYPMNFSVPPPNLQAYFPIYQPDTTYISQPSMQYSSQDARFTASVSEPVQIFQTPTHTLAKNDQPNEYGEADRKLKGKVDDTQMSVLVEQLSKGTYECMVCCERVRQAVAIWSCKACFHVFHLYCIRKWARSSHVSEGEDSGWRCPACQNISDRIPNEYRCFCNKVVDPQWNRRDTPHSCGETCKKRRLLGDCPHPCNLLCHPGPCPPCTAMTTRSCLCGKLSQMVKCGQDMDLQCTEVCGKLLNCGMHTCNITCHAGDCSPCEEVVEQVCYCSKSTRTVTCGSCPTDDDTQEMIKYACDKICERDLSCGNHKCEHLCHSGPCSPCKLRVAAVTHCPCGQIKLEELSATKRRSCLYPVPTCQSVCNKPLPCSSDDSIHLCQKMCHEGPCGPCSGQTEVRCRCGFATKVVPCTSLSKYTGDKAFMCDKRCTKKRQCGRHKCGQQCCTDVEHPCNLLCNRKLKCGSHVCEEPCHIGNCHSCWHVCFDELSCHCGASVMYPPIPCGTKPPECKEICSRVHHCNHPVMHACHSEEKCPPCTFLMSKWCNGNHELRSHIPCHITNVSCGLPCNKVLPCGQHKCKTVCHKGPCLKESESCNQPCRQLRDGCGHTCAAVCHVGKPCPGTTCKAEVLVKCPCGHRKEKMPCYKHTALLSKLTMSVLGSKVTEMQSGQSVDISGLMNANAKQGNCGLECNEECAIIERNRRISLALQIANPELSNKLGNPSYTDFLKDFAKKNLQFTATVEKQLADLVQTAKKAKQPRKSHAFPIMNRMQRRCVHELAEFYGCQTQSYDEEPKKNVVATAERDKCFMPSISLTTLVQREKNPKAPLPIPPNSDAQQLKAAAKAASQSTAILGTASEPVVDYFDMS